MAKKAKKCAAPTPVEHYEMHKEFTRPTLMTGEYSGINPEELLGRPTPTVSYPLDDAARAGREPYQDTDAGAGSGLIGRAGAPRPPQPDLSDEFAARDPDLDPQYIWRGKKPNDINTLETAAPFIYQQEKIFPRMLIEEMKRETARRRDAAEAQRTFGDFADDFDPNAKPAFYNHEEGWKNRMILGDSLQVMASLAENERLRGKVQMVYFDPPYGIKFNSNWQPSTKSTNVKDGAVSDITREPEMVKAFRDTWHDGIHSYLGYLRDRLTVARDLLADTGSVFVQISDENVHKVRAIMEEIFGEENFVNQIFLMKTTGAGSPGELTTLPSVGDYIVWFAKNKAVYKYHKRLSQKTLDGAGSRYRSVLTPDGKSCSLMSWMKEFHIEDEATALRKIESDGVHLFTDSDTTSQSGTDNARFPIVFEGREYKITSGSWKSSEVGMGRLIKASRILTTSRVLRYRRCLDDFAAVQTTNCWDDIGGIQSRSDPKVYVCQTATEAIKRCMLMCTDPGDLVLDPTCGSGTTAYVAEQWGRRWITIDTSRVALALARKRLMTAKYPYYLLADSEPGLKKEMEITGKVIQRPTFNKISQGFVYERVPHITLKAIANNSEIDTIWEKYVAESERLRTEISDRINKINRIENSAGPDNPVNPVNPVKKDFRDSVSPCDKILEEWEIPFEVPSDWSDAAKKLHADFMALKRKRQAEIDASIARTAETEYLYDKPYEDKKRVRVAGPFTVESVAPVRSLVSEADGTQSDPALKLAHDVDYGHGANYVTRMIRTLRKNGVKQARKGDKIDFTSVEPWANGKYIAAEAWGAASEATGKAKRYAVAFGPEFGSVTRLDMKNAAREACECGFDVLVYCAFNFEAYVEEGSDQAMGRLKVLQARMNSDLHMTTDLKDTGHGNPFVIFGEPDIALAHTEDDLYTVTIKGVDVYDPKTDEVRSDDADAIDCWMLDTDYSGEAFFARQVYFPGKEDIYKAFKVFLKNDIDEEAWESVAKTTSRPFPRPASGQIAVKVINHFGDEVMKVFEIK